MAVSGAYFSGDILRMLESLKSASDEFENKEKRSAYQKALYDVGLAFGIVLQYGFVLVDDRTQP